MTSLTPHYCLCRILLVNIIGDRQRLLTRIVRAGGGNIANRDSRVGFLYMIYVYVYVVYVYIYFLGMSSLYDILSVYIFMYAYIYIYIYNILIYIYI